MNGVGHRFVGEHLDDLLDQPPAREMDEIAVAAAAVGADRRLRSGEGSEPRDQLGRVGQRRSIGDMDVTAQASAP